MRLVNWLLAIAFATASFDLILLVNVGGTLRLSQVLLGVVCIAATAHIIQHGTILWPRGGTALALWLFSQLLFLPVSGNVVLGSQFFVLLAFTIVGVFAVVQLYGRSPWIEWLMRAYLLSYVFVGMFGLVQFLLPLAGGPGIFVRQWEIHGRLARINGFSYEPSFYATYMMMGWIMLVELRMSKARMTAGRVWGWITIAMTMSLILCTSKLGWVAMVVELVTRLAVPAWKGLRHTSRRYSRGLILVRIPRQRTVLYVAMILLVCVAGGTFVARKLDVWMFLQGTGIGGTAAHSADARIGPAIATWETFREHPFVGRTLGGVPIAVAARSGVVVTTMDQLRLYWGFPVALDVLTASGIFGVLPFLWFLYVTTFGATRFARQHWPTESAKWLRALGRGMIFECLMLLADQNLLRVYAWFQVTMVMLVAYHVEFGTPRQEAFAAQRAGLVEGEASA